jgi:hypothetical protein
VGGYVGHTHRRLHPPASELTTFRPPPPEATSYATVEAHHRPLNDADGISFCIDIGANTIVTIDRIALIFILFWRDSGIQSVVTSVVS